MALDTIADLADAAGSSGMVGGQVIDLISEGQPLTQGALELLHSKKTGALFIAAVCGGARLGGAQPAQLESLRSYAEHWGSRFRSPMTCLMSSRVLNISANAHRKIRSAARPPTLRFGIQRSRALAQELAHQAREALAGFDSRAEPLRMLAKFAVERSL